jgi:hypothetical protein
MTDDITLISVEYDDFLLVISPGIKKIKYERLQLAE